MKKSLLYLRIAGLLLMAFGFIWSQIATGSLQASKNDVSTFCILAGIILTLPSLGYKLWHFKEYRQYNITFLLLLAFLVIFGLIVYHLKG